MKNQSGNVLFLILIAVALFAALGYAVSNSSRSGGSSPTKDKIETNASAIIQYVSVIRSSIQKMRLANNCQDTQLDFSSLIYQRNNGNPIDPSNTSVPSGFRCHLFSSAGGSVVPIVPPAGSLAPPTAVATQWKPGHYGVLVYQLKNIGTDDAGGTESANDLMYQMNYLTKETCLALNDKLGVANPSGDAPTLTITGSAGLYINGSLAATRIVEGPQITGKREFCFKSGTDYNFTFTLLER